MYDETLTGPRELPAYPHHLRGSLTQKASLVSLRLSKPSISVKQETPSLVASEMERIKNDAKLKGLIQE